MDFLGLWIMILDVEKVNSLKTEGGDFRKKLIASTSFKTFVNKFKRQPRKNNVAGPAVKLLLSY